VPHGPWPPASPWVWGDSFWDQDGNPHPLTMYVYFDSPVNGGGTLTLDRIDYERDAENPWHYMIVDRADSERVSLEMTAETGTFGTAALNDIGLESFNDIGSLTAGVNPE
jgi:hypothetical protein